MLSSHAAPLIPELVKQLGKPVPFLAGRTQNGAQRHHQKRPVANADGFGGTQGIQGLAGAGADAVRAHEAAKNNNLRSQGL
jgi:hypothetical protein